MIDGSDDITKASYILEIVRLSPILVYGDGQLLTTMKEPGII